MQRARVISWQDPGASRRLTRMSLSLCEKGHARPWVGTPNLNAMYSADDLQSDRSACDITSAPSCHAGGVPEINHAPLAQWESRARPGGEPRVTIDQPVSPKTVKGNVRYVP